MQYIYRSIRPEERGITPSPPTLTLSSDLYPDLRQEAIAYIANSSNKIYTKISKVLTSEVLMMFDRDDRVEKIISFNGSVNEDPGKQAIVLKQAYKLMNHNITQARAREMAQIRGMLTGKSNNRLRR